MGERYAPGVIDDFKDMPDDETRRHALEWMADLAFNPCLSERVQYLNYQHAYTVERDDYLILFVYPLSEEDKGPLILAIRRKDHKVETTFFERLLERFRN